MERELHELALFAGAGGGILGGKLLGWRTVCAVEIEPYPRSVLMARQDDGCLPPFPIWDDVRTFDGRPWRGLVDVVSGGFPCQDISVAGARVGIEGERSGLWREMARIVGEVRPGYVLVENSSALPHRGLGTVLGDLAKLGYDARWGVLGACDAGLDHERERTWIVANAVECKQVTWSRWPGWWIARTQEAPPHGLRGGGKGNVQQERREPGVARIAHGVASGMDRVAAIGNGQAAPVVPLAWHLLKEPINPKLRK